MKAIAAAKLLGLLSALRSVEAAVAKAAVAHAAGPATYDYGEITLGATLEYTKLWNDAGSGAARDGGIWHPNAPNGFRPFGSIAVNTHSDTVNNKRITLVASLNPNKKPVDPKKPALTDPTGYELIWKDEKSKATEDGSFWRPKCPAGYVSLGDVGSAGWEEPTSPVWCLRQDLAKIAKFDEKSIWDDAGSGAIDDVSLWNSLPEPTGVDGAEYIPIDTGNFYASKNYEEPLIACWSLAIDVPKAYTNFAASVPNVTSDHIPTTGALFDETVQASVVLPIVALFSATDKKALRFRQSPFVSIVKTVSWFVEGVWENNSAGNVTVSKTITYGLSDEQTKSFEHTAGITLSANAGFSVVKTSVSLNYQFTSHNSASHTEFQNTQKKEDFTVGRHYVTAMFCKMVGLTVSTLNNVTISKTQSLAANEFHLSGGPLKQ